MNIAIDGPAGAGKSTIAKRLSAELGFLYLDTGAMYRAVAYQAVLTQTPYTDEARVCAMLQTTAIDIAYRDGAQQVYLNGQNVSDAIRRHEISQVASNISALACVREKMVALQRTIAARCDSILDGRDIGTCVLPHADFKFYLTADVGVRAQRRYDELKHRGQACDRAQIERDIALRDRQDSSRAVSPLKKAEDAIEIDTGTLSVDQVVARIRSIVEGRKV